MYDIMLTHGLSKSSVHGSVWRVVNAVHVESSLFFNSKDKDFPSHEGPSTAKFDMVSMAVNGMLIWTIQPSSTEYAQLEIGQTLFHCYHKDEFRMVLVASCDHSSIFRWADTRYPVVTSDYLAFSTSMLGCKLEQEESNISLQSNTLIGDNA